MLCFGQPSPLRCVLLSPQGLATLRGPHLPRPETLRIPGAGLDDAYKVFILIRFLLAAGSKIKCAAGTLRAYLRRRTDDAFASFVSSRSLSVRGSWGAAPSAFWYGAPGGTQGPLGKGGAAERWRVAYPIGIATRHGAKPATTHTSKRNATPAVAVQIMPLQKPAPTISNHKNPARSFYGPGR